MWANGVQSISGLVDGSNTVIDVMSRSSCCFESLLGLKADIDRDRLSFTHAVTVLKNGLDEFQMVDPVQRPALYQRMLDDIASELLPIRQLRINPRVIKEKGSKFLKKRLEHQNWPQPNMCFRDAISVI